MTTYDSVWDALEDDPIKRENYKIRSELGTKILSQIRDMKQREAAKILNTTQPRVSVLLKANFSAFRIDTLIDMVHRLGMHASVKVTGKKKVAA